MRDPTALSPGVPSQVAIAFSLLAAYFILSAGQAAWLGTRLRLPAGSVAVAVVIVIALYTLWLYGLYRRLNWLRWLTIGGAVLGLLAIPWATRASQGLITVPIRVLKYALYDIGAFLLCLPQARAWYQRPDRLTRVGADREG